MALATATAATGRTNEGWSTGLTMDESVVTSEEIPTIEKNGTSRRVNKIDLKEKKATVDGEETNLATTDEWVSAVEDRPMIRRDSDFAMKENDHTVEVEK